MNRSIPFWYRIEIEHKSWMENSIQIDSSALVAAWRSLKTHFVRWKIWISGQVMCENDV